MIPHIWLDTMHVHHRGDHMHPEHPDRIAAIEARIQTWDPRSVHMHMTTVDLPAAHGKGWSLIDGDTYMTAATPALLKRGAIMIEDAAIAIGMGVTNCAFVLVRPPGHHATFESASGFCHQNNAYIAARRLRMCGYERVGILDWDAHHGDGTEACVEKGGDPNIRFCSMHAFGKGVFPGTGSKKRTDQILNVPLPVGTGAASYLNAFRSQVLPFLTAVDALIVSAGYDGHEKDPMGLLRLQLSTYTEMASDLKEMGCPLLFLLEGGYRPDVLASCVEATLKPWLVLA